MTDPAQLTRLRRALTLSEKLWRLERAQLVQIDARISRLRQAEEGLLEGASQGLVDSRLASLQLAALAQARDTALQEQGDRLRRARAHGQRTKSLERLEERATADLRRDRTVAERRRLGGVTRVSST